MPDTAPAFITSFLQANPVISFSAGMILFMLMLRYLGSFIKNDTRSEAIDKAGASLVASLEKRVDVLSAAQAASEAERERYYNKTNELTEKIAILTERIRVLERLGDDCAKECARLMAIITLKDAELINLREQLIVLQGAANGRRTTDKP